MELSDLETFVAIARQGSLSKAAEGLFIAQPTATHRLKRLEDELGTALFDRRREGVVLTSAGERLLPHAVAAVRSAHEAMAAVREPSPPSRPLLLASAPTVAAYRLPAILGALVREVPGLELSVHVARSAEVASLVARGEADAGFIRSGSETPGLETTVIAREAVVLVASPAATPTGPLGWLSGPFIGYDRTSPFWHDLDVAVRKEGAQGRMAMELDSLEGVKAMVAEGLGAAFLPLPAVRREIQEGRFIVVPIASDLPSRAIALVTRGTPPFHPALRRLAHLALQVSAGLD